MQFNTNGDKMYCSSGSDLQGILKWKKFTNSLRLRALLRVIDSKELGDLAKAELKKMLADPTTYPVLNRMMTMLRYISQELLLMKLQ